MAKAFVVAAPASGSGKTLLTLGLLRALRDAGLRSASAKAGPDYIDPRFHEMATGRPCPSLDLWAMGPARCRALLAEQARDADTVIVEGVMGLFDGPAGGTGSTADLAAALGLPVVLVIDCRHMAQSVAALVQGFVRFNPELEFAGVILNRVASERHETLLRQSLDGVGVPVLGALRQQKNLVWPSRHLGLVQAGDHPQTEQFIADAAMAAGDLLAPLRDVGTEIVASAGSTVLLPPPGQRIAVALDQAFSFAYPHVLSGWQRAGAEIKPFSPLADEASATDADVIFLPGGYPELHAGKLSGNKIFMQSLQKADALIYGECGGFMVLGEALVDADGASHAMAGLLPLATSFKSRKLQLGYRTLRPMQGGPWAAPLRGHEFHYSTIVSEGQADPLFAASDAGGNDLGCIGLRRGKVMGSFAHVIAEAA